MQESVAVPDPCRVEWSIVHVMPVGANTESVTVPVNPLVGETVIVDVDDSPVFAVTGVVDVMVISDGWAAVTWKVSVVVCGAAPPVAVTVTV